METFRGRAIQELIHRYADSVNRADWDETIKVFAPDAVWESPLLGMHFDSAEAFVANLRETGPSSELLVQTATSPVVTLVNDDRARATTTGDEWKCTHRVFVPTYLGHDCVTGDVPIGREELRAPS